LTAKGDAVIMGRRNGASVAIEIPKAELHRLAAALKFPLKPKTPQTGKDRKK